LPHHTLVLCSKNHDDFLYYECACDEHPLPISAIDTTQYRDTKWYLLTQTGIAGIDYAIYSHILD